MKRNFRSTLIGAASLLTLGLAACTDPTTEPTSTVGEERIFADPGSYQAFLAKIYAGLSVTGQQGPAGDKDISTISDEGFSQYMRLYWEHQELPSDEAVLAWNDGSVQDFNGMVWGSNNDFLGGMFARIYLQITWANLFLEQTEDAKLTERGNVSPQLKTQIQQFRAEARFLRALSYWHGLDLFGPIPIVTKNAPIPPKQNTRQEVYDFIVSELIAIQPDLPLAGPGNYGRATQEAVSMLLAHVYLNAEVYTGAPHYTEAMNAASDAIAGPFSLDPSYQHLFQADNNTSPEIIFPVVQDGLHTQSYGGVTFLIHASCGGSMDPAVYGVDGCWWGLRLKPEAYNLVVADPRASYLYSTGQTVAITSLTNFNEGIAAPKFTNITSLGVNGSNSSFPDTDFPMFRLADAYLIYAEAAVRTNTNLGQALTYVNQIRERAYGNTSGDITAPELTLQFILDERGRELLWEAQRRSDLIRFGLFTGGTYLWAWKGNVQGGQATDAHLNLYPIPATQLSANPNLKQNPGY
ncbi:MAG TPA: RagB/SusD family nutrient uptake outer membrane protein [Gemmatimonadales bacterium]|nr:RagB/SusD family nutrient uptake outer membrane protein [Gemmatimonadales bacterium]